MLCYNMDNDPWLQLYPHSTFDYLSERVQQYDHARAKVKFDTFKSRMTRAVLTAYLP